jgi:hypothetical protein
MLATQVQRRVVLCTHRPMSVLGHKQTQRHHLSPGPLRQTPQGTAERATKQLETASDRAAERSSLSLIVALLTVSFDN